LELKKYKQSLANQVAENDSTIKRYKKQIDEGKQFAISKFAKELLDVRDNLAFALKHTDLAKLEEIEDIEVVKTQFKNVVKGQ
jgi:molecular chaperone GrpE